MLLHINPTRQRGKRTGSLARASGWYMTFFAAGVISPFLPQSGPNACAQRNETGSPETTSNTLSIATSHQPTPRPSSLHGIGAGAKQFAVVSRCLGQPTFSMRALSLLKHGYIHGVPSPASAYHQREPAASHAASATPHPAGVGPSGGFLRSGLSRDTGLGVGPHGPTGEGRTPLAGISWAGS